MSCRALAAAPPPWSPQLTLLLALLLPPIVLGGQDDPSSGDLDYEDSDEQEHKDVSTYNGHSLVLDLSSLSVLAALKLKLVVVLLVVAAVYMLMTKGYKTQCLFGSCRPSYSTYGYYPYVDYTYMGYEVPSASSRRPSGAPGAPVGVGVKDSPHLSDLTARVWNSIDIAGMAFSALNIQEDDCRRKLVCQADRAAAANPILRAALSWFSPSLARYRTDRSRPEDGAGAELQWLRELGDPGDPCEEMYPQCRHRDLPPALGGPGPLEHTVYLEESIAAGGLGAPAQLHHQGGHHHHLQLHQSPVSAPALAEQPWHGGGGAQNAPPAAHAQLYRHGYQYEVTHLPYNKQPYRPPVETPLSSPLERPVPARDGASLLAQKPVDEDEDDIDVLNGAAASPATVVGLAPQREDVADGAAGRSPSQPPPSAAGAPWVGGGGGGGEHVSVSPPEPRSPAPATAPASQAPQALQDQAPAPLAPQVWRRLLPGTPKAHRD